MSKLLSLLIAASFATVSAGSFAASHGGAAKGEKPMDEKTEMKVEKKEETKDVKVEKKADKKDMKEEKKAY
ncbi:hypothetical protein [Accumulibacter sp.]|uniref:hypothetical protein n=1 Tax=Accumulibacter sp. TaxID=2053492 RepID=UPI0026301987|nr:hypothetical protein [Accumulibacter sp.]HRD94390.1 hypothetical protein [Accumulibacter sp.]